MDYKQLCEDLRHIEDIAYEYRFNNEVLGIDVNEFEDLMSNSAHTIEMFQSALADLKKVSVCGTCVHYNPHGKETQCNVRKLWKTGGNWAGCSRWQWRGEKCDDK